eukprot:GDKH01020757.1.p4 GENE.GDKH01020757.1~~GDKH01020757.1.p4  ORF type:complete len:55 (+),score=4.41 GDKH01020757.1:43-207(+)
MWRGLEGSRFPTGIGWWCYRGAFKEGRMDHLLNASFQPDGQHQEGSMSFIGIRT